MRDRSLDFMFRFILRLKVSCSSLDIMFILLEWAKFPMVTTEIDRYHVMYIMYLFPTKTFLFVLPIFLLILYIFHIGLSY